MSERTPGPWEVGRTDEDEWGIHGTVIYSGNDQIALVPAEEEGKALPDAYLVAAAPEMLAVLERVKANAIAQHGRLSPSTILDVQAAIMKATGALGGRGDTARRPTQC